MKHLLRALIVSTALLRMPAARQEHGHTIRGTDETPAEGIDRVNESAEDVLKTRVCTHNQGGGDRGTDETPAEGVDRVNEFAEDVFKTRACTHNQGRARGTDETPAESIDRVNVLAENACCKTVL